jgi:uncharacterized protein DUF3323/uncharacterized protein DUF2399
MRGQAHRALLRTGAQAAAGRRPPVTRGTGGDLTRITVKTPDDKERRVIIGITGQYRPEGTVLLAVRLADLDTAVRETGGHGLAGLATLVLRPLAACQGAARPRTVGERRDLWDQCGIIVDDLASRVLKGQPRPAPWDPALADAMSAEARAVYEEPVAADLIRDLG